MHFRRLRGPARPSIIVTLLMAVVPLGCGGRVEMALVDPDKYQFHSCAQLVREMNTLRARTQELRSLYERASRDPSGQFVARVSYEPEYLSAIGNMQLIETAARDKDCSPPVTAVGG
jgi:hypothetical protein